MCRGQASDTRAAWIGPRTKVWRLSSAAIHPLPRVPLDRESVEEDVGSQRNSSEKFWFNSSLSKASLRTVGCAFIVLSITLSWLGIAAAQQEAGVLPSLKTVLEVEKLKLEIARLRELPSWFTAVVGLLVGVIGTAASIWVTRRTRIGALDKSIHDKRIESYPKLVEACMPLALYFPKASNKWFSRASNVWSLDRDECSTIGHAMSVWYLGGGGILLSEKARDAYFMFARALTRASSSDKELEVPSFPEDYKNISKENVDNYMRLLRKKFSLKKKLGLNLKFNLKSPIIIRHKFNLNDVERWQFGNWEPKNEGEERRPLAIKYKDFVFLQQLSSNLRTALTKDLRSRRRPS